MSVALFNSLKGVISDTDTVDNLVDTYLRENHEDLPADDIRNLLGMITDRSVRKQLRYDLDLDF
jgi:hypothetical protein